MRFLRTSTAALLAVLLPLAACHKAPEPAPEPENNVVEEAPLPENNVVEETPAPENNMMEEAPKPKPKPKPWPSVSADQQMMDDADATGMTSRVSRDGSGAANDQ
jgi:outer membrane biosynthesis protein TonB